MMGMVPGSEMGRERAGGSRRLTDWIVGGGRIDWPSPSYEYCSGHKRPLSFSSCSYQLLTA